MPAGQTKGYRVLPTPDLHFRINAVGEPIAMIVEFLVRMLGVPIADETGLAGEYDFKLDYIQPNKGRADGTPPSPEELAAAEDPQGPAIFTALQQQLGLRLVSKKIKVSVLAIDHIERTPGAN